MITPALSQNHTDSYINRKSFASVVLQAVCTKDLIFTDVSTGWPGSMHDAMIYNKSKLAEVINRHMVDEEYHTLGDLAYPLQKCLMTLFY